MSADLVDSKFRNQKSRPTVFVVDDDASVRKGLSRLIRSAGLNVETFASAQDFLKREHFDEYGCIVLDVRMPGLSGPDLQETLVQADYTMPIIFITGHGDIPMSVQAMKKGAVDFLPKPFDEKDILDSIKSAIGKDRKARKEYAEMTEAKNRIDGLTARECEVFTLVIVGMLNKQIAAELKISEKTVKVHRGRVMKKIQVVSVAELVQLAAQAGIIFPSVSAE